MKKRQKVYPVLMYHEVSVASSDKEKANFMTPIYNLSSSVFEQQLRAIKELNLTTRLIHDIVAKGRGGNNSVFLTFDDGCLGNYTEALPLLLKYQQKATFFVTTNLIGTDNYMNWDQVRELVNQGMAVQSHAMNHEHLTALSKERLMHVLAGSKEIIEENISKSVTAISFPHGSYNQQTVDCAAEAGYIILCTSDVSWNAVGSLSVGQEPRVLGRVAVTTKTRLDTFVGLIQGKRSEIVKEQLWKGLKNLLKRIIGVENYGKLYRFYFGIETHSK